MASSVFFRPTSERGNCRSTVDVDPLASGRRRSYVVSVNVFEEDLNVLEIKVEETEDYTVCSPSGELDAYTVGAFRESLGELAGHKRVLIDLSGVPFMDSAGLGALIGGIRRAREAEGDVAVVCDRPALSRLLHTTGFDRIVPVTESIEEAIEALDDPGTE